jgi:hypothetical protein
VGRRYGFFLKPQKDFPLKLKGKKDYLALCVEKSTFESASSEDCAVKTEVSTQPQSLLIIL